MNIFYTDTNPTVAARNMVDRHVVKMILETAQILSTAHRYCDGKPTKVNYVDRRGRKKTKIVLRLNNDDDYYAATHINHPSTVWARQTSSNYEWLYEHLLALGDEYTFRYGKQHKTIVDRAAILKNLPNNILVDSMTTMPSCMDKQYILSNDPVINYRNYYIVGKRHIHRWTKRTPPNWLGLPIVEMDTPHTKLYKTIGEQNGTMDTN